jgi:hypothetical protein
MPAEKRNPLCAEASSPTRKTMREKPVQLSLMAFKLKWREVVSFSDRKLGIKPDKPNIAGKS